MTIETLEIPEHLKDLIREMSRVSHAAVTACPTCGHPMPIDDIAGSLSPKPRQIYENVKAAGTQGLHQNRLEHLMYGDEPSGGPRSDSIKVMICRAINPKLKPLGLRIKAHCRVYRLEKLP